MLKWSIFITCCRYQAARCRPRNSRPASTPKRAFSPSPTLAFVTRGSSPSCAVQCSAGKSVFDQLDSYTLECFDTPALTGARLCE